MKIEVSFDDKSTALLEAAVAALTANTEAQTAVAGVLTKGATAKTAAKPKAAPKEEVAETPAAEETTEEKPKPKRKPRAKKRKPVDILKEVRANVATHMKEIKGTEGAAEIMGHYKAILEFVGAEDEADGKFKVTAIPEDRAEEAEGYINKVIAGDDPELPVKEEEDEPETEEEDDELVF